MKKVVLLLVLILCSFYVFADESVPSLTQFMQLYGNVTDLPAGNFQLKATLSGQDFTTAITNKQWGYNPTFKITGNEGDTITLYVVDGLGKETQLATAQYHAGTVGFYPLNFNQNQNFDDGGDDEGNNERSQARDSNSDDNDNNDLPPNLRTCTMVWSCGDYSTCQNGLQTRTCTRVDNCQEKLDSNQIGSITPMAKPQESQSCEKSLTTPTSQPLQATCAPQAKRCLGQILQQCNAQGDGYNALQACPEGCDPINLKCNPELTTAQPDSEESGLPSWLLPLVGVILLIAIIAIVAYMIVEKKKYAPLKDYIALARGQGFEDHQIRSRLVQEGWDTTKIDKYMK